MKILYVTAMLPYGSTEAFTIPEIKGLLSLGHEVLIVPVYPKGLIVHGDALSLVERTRSHPLFSRETAGVALGEFLQKPSCSLASIGSFLKDSNVQTLMKNLAVFQKALWLAHLAREWRADHIQANWASTPATVALVASELSGVSWGFTAHRVDIRAGNLLQIKVNKSRFVRFISQDGLDTAEALGIKRLKAKAVVLRMGVDLPTNVWAPAQIRATPTALCPASLISRKGHKYLIEAVAILKRKNIRFNLLLAGQGNLRNELEKSVRELNLAEEIRFLGQVDHEDLLKHYRQGQVDLVVLPSLHEGIPVALIEAMAHGVPVVSTTVGGTPELLEGGAGLLVPPQDSQGLANALEKLICDSELRTRTGQAGRVRAYSNYNIQKVVAQLAGRIEGTGSANSASPTGTFNVSGN